MRKTKMLKWSDPDQYGTTKAGLFEIRVYQPTSSVKYPGHPDGKFVASFFVRPGMRHELGVFASYVDSRAACETYIRVALGRNP